MDTSGTRMALGVLILQLLLLCLSYFSMADNNIYHPVDLISIYCGSTINFLLDGRNWTGDSNTKFLSEISNHSVGAPALTSSTQRGPYNYARLSHSQFTYSFPVKASGPKFLRLFFYSTSYDQKFDRDKAYFSVKAGSYTLLKDFNASLNADAVDDPGQPDIMLKEYCINVLEDSERLNITFIPSTTDSYAFINGIEIVSMPPYLYYSNPNVNDDTELPQHFGGPPYAIQNNFALETKYRLNVGGRDITPSGDTGMLRTWDVDDNYINSPSSTPVDYKLITNLNFTDKTPNYTAPDEVYRTLRGMGSDASINEGFNLTWQLAVDPGFTYLLRLHFCQLNPVVNQTGDMIFIIYVQDQLVDDMADILDWSNNQKGVPVVREYAVIIPANQGKTYLSLKLHPHRFSSIKDAQINAIEVFKINNTEGSLAGPNPEPPLQTPKVSLESINKKSNSTTRTIAAVAGAVFSVVLLFLIVVFLLIKRKNNAAVHKGSKQNDGTSRGGGSSSLPANLCRHFSVAEIRAATNNFDELFVVGVGGFGNVYKGYIDDNSTPVAVKRLKQGSQQGMNEFVNEIEMLSQLRHLHLVSLIGYCYESNEMILVYEYMDRGTLRDHLYDTDNPPLSWKQRIQICIGAARGLHYLHTGAKHMIIHRDVKTTNILLDEKWVSKVSDFGLSRVGPTGSSITHVSTQVKGSVGYLDPEYYKRQRLTEKSDVYSFGVVLLEVLSGRQPLLRMVEKQQMSLVHWAKHLYQKGSLSAIMDSSLKGQIAPECLRKFGEIALGCLLEDGTQRPSMNDVVGMLEFALQLQDSATAVNGVTQSGGNYEDTNDLFSISQSSGHVSDCSKSTGFSTTSDVDRSFVSKESDGLIPEHIFSEIKDDPKGR